MAGSVNYCRETETPEKGKIGITTLYLPKESLCMYCIAESRVLPALRDEQRKALLQQAPLLSLCELLEAVSDPRGRHGMRYDLPFLLCCLIAALLSNCNGSEAVAQWCRDHHE